MDSSKTQSFWLYSTRSSWPQLREIYPNQPRLSSAIVVPLVYSPKRAERGVELQQNLSRREVKARRCGRRAFEWFGRKPQRPPDCG